MTKTGNNGFWLRSLPCFELWPDAFICLGSTVKMLQNCNFLVSTNSSFVYCAFKIGRSTWNFSTMFTNISYRSTKNLIILLHQKAYLSRFVRKLVLVNAQQGKKGIFPSVVCGLASSQKKKISEGVKLTEKTQLPQNGHNRRTPSHVRLPREAEPNGAVVRDRGPCQAEHWQADGQDLPFDWKTNSPTEQRLTWTAWWSWNMDMKRDPWSIFLVHPLHDDYRHDSSSKLFSWSVHSSITVKSTKIAALQSDAVCNLWVALDQWKSITANWKLGYENVTCVSTGLRKNK